MAFHIVHPLSDQPDRLFTAAIVRSFESAAEAFALIDWVRLQLRRIDFRVGMIELIVVDEQRQPVAQSILGRPTEPSNSFPNSP